MADEFPTWTVTFLAPGHITPLTRFIRAQTCELAEGVVCRLFGIPTRIISISRLEHIGLVPDYV